MNKYRGRISQQGGNESCIPIHENISVKSVDNQGVFNVGGHTYTNEGNNNAQYQSKYAHVNKFEPLAVEDNSFAFDTDSSVGRLDGVDAQVVETQDRKKSKWHKTGKKKSVNYDNNLLVD